MTKLKHSASKPKLIVMGHARHGKDTVSEILRDSYGFSFISSSLFCAEEILFPKLREKYGYPSVAACFDDRSNHRAEWYEEIRAFNKPDPTKLGRAIFNRHDIYCGLRHKAEFHAMRNAGVFHLAIWVDASDRHSAEDKSSCTVEPWMADFVIDNNGTVEDLKFNVEQFYIHRLARHFTR